MSLRSLLLALALVSVGCATASPHPAGVSATQTDARVGTYTSSRWGFATNSFWIEGPKGLVLIDTQFLPSAGLAAVDAAERATGKKVVAAVVLHANPDKFNGTASLQARGIRVLTSKQVADLIPAIHEKRYAAFHDRYAPDYPEVAAKPEVFGDATQVLELAGLSLTAHVMGKGCSEAHVAVEWEGHLFVGDLVGNGTHAWLEIGQPLEWRARLAELAKLHPRFVHPGRGASGGAELLTAEDAYLAEVVAITRAAKSADDAKAKIRARFPSLDFPVFLEIGIPATYAALKP
jgi:glyoxylase-like metal-dependent hydrolase (beta-lactamase superfamily II)